MWMAATKIIAIVLVSDVCVHFICICYRCIYYFCIDIIAAITGSVLGSALLFAVGTTFCAFLKSRNKRHNHINVICASTEGPILIRDNMPMEDNTPSGRGLLRLSSLSLVGNVGDEPPSYQEVVKTSCDHEQLLAPPPPYSANSTATVEDHSFLEHNI